MLTIDEINSLAQDEYEVLDFGIIAVEREQILSDFIGIQTTLFSLNTFVVRDAFSTVLWKDEAEGVVEYVNGFLGAD